MWKLIQKNFKIALYSKSFLFLAFYVLYLAMMKIPTLGWAAAANVIVTFVLIGSFSSMVEGVGKRNHADDVYFSLPLSRKTLLYANFVMTLIYIVFALTFITICNWIFRLTLPANLLDIRLVTVGEAVYIFLIMAMILFLEGLMPFLSGLEHRNKISFFFYLLTVIFLSLWAYPAIIILLSQGNLEMRSLSGPFALLTRVIEVLNQPLALYLTIIFIIVVSISSIKLSLRHFIKKEI